MPEVSEWIALDGAVHRGIAVNDAAIAVFALAGQVWPAYSRTYTRQNIATILGFENDARAGDFPAGWAGNMTAGDSVACGVILEPASRGKTALLVKWAAHVANSFMRRRSP